MEIGFGTFEDVPLNEEVMGMFQGLYHEGAGFEEYVNHLSNRTLVIVKDKGKFQGFATLDIKEPNYVEGHLYFPANTRRYTVKTMKELIKMTQELGRVPYTSVSSDYPHIKRCLELLGFRVVKVEENVMRKSSGSYDLIHLELLKEGD